MPVVAQHQQRRHQGTDRPRRFEGLERRQMFERGAPTLDERISSAWTGLVSSGSAECPVCSSSVRAATPCGRCGSELS